MLQLYHKRLAIFVALWEEELGSFRTWATETFNCLPFSNFRVLNHIFTHKIKLFKIPKMQYKCPCNWKKMLRGQSTGQAGLMRQVLQGRIAAGGHWVRAEWSEEVSSEAHLGGKNAFQAEKSWRKGPEGNAWDSLEQRGASMSGVKWEGGLFQVVTRKGPGAWHTVLVSHGRGLQLIVCDH